jgi:hypothetical protein
MAEISPISAASRKTRRAVSSLKSSTFSTRSGAPQEKKIGKKEEVFSTSWKRFYHNLTNGNLYQWVINPNGLVQILLFYDSARVF